MGHILTEQMKITTCPEWFETYNEISDWIATVTSGTNVIFNARQRQILYEGGRTDG